MGEKCERCGREYLDSGDPDVRCWRAWASNTERDILDCDVETCDDVARFRAPLDAQIATLTRERDAAIAVAAGLRARLSLAEVEVAMERSWCRICRTEGRGDYRGRDRHPHDPACVLASGRCTEHTTNEEAKR